MVTDGTLTITLNSDLCAGSGYAYAGVIDSDICYDDFGLPYIPAKRVKGCMREAAQSVLYDFIDSESVKNLFGTAGENSCGNLFVGNARIQNYEEIVTELKKTKEKDREIASYINQQEILKQFTQIKAQTSIDENGVADDSTLRYTRVVKKHSPITGTPLVFEAEITLNEATDELKEVLEKIALATRSIGMHRNRGMGSVSCKITFHEKENENTFETNQRKNQQDQKETEWVRISYQLKNVQPLMLGSNDDQTSETMIRGQRVLGGLAGTYLSLKGKSAQDQAFQDLFLAGNAIFTNLVPCKEGNAYYPAPLFLNQLKKTKKLVNTQFHYVKEACKKGTEQEYNPDAGNQPKKLKGKYVLIDDENQVDIMEVEQTMIYHHSHYKKNADGTEGILYTQSAVKENQLYFGQIYVKKEYAELVNELLNRSEFRFGRSRSAQYGKCILVDNKEKNKEESKKENIPFDGKKGQTIMVTLLSDGIFQSTDGTGYTVYYDELQKIVAQELGILQIQKESERFHSMIQTKEINGYQTMWNLHKQTIPAVAAGSAFVYELQEDAKLTKPFIGERNLEGYGQIRIFCLDDMQYSVQSKENKNSSEKTDEKKITVDLQSVAVKKLICNNLIAVMQEKLKFEAAKAEKIRLSATTIGKATLMLQQSLEDNRNDRNKAFCSFSKKIEAVKREAERVELENKVLKLIAKENPEEQDEKVKEWVLEEQKLENLLQKHDNNEQNSEIAVLKRVEPDNYKDLILDLWGNFIMEYLTAQKYQKKMEGE